MGRPLRVLAVDDCEQDTALLVRELTRGGFEVFHERVETAEAMAAALDHRAWDVVLCDFTMPRFDTHSAYGLLRDRDLDLPFIVISGTIDDDAAVDSLKAGAHDFLRKDKLVRLVPAVERELREANIRLENRKSADALRRSEARYRQLLEALQEGIWAVDLEARTTFANGRMAEMLGFTVDGMQGRSLFSFMDERLIPPVASRLARLGLGTREQFELQLRRKDGQQIHLLMEAAPHLDEAGNRCGSIAGVIDVTERRQLQEQLLLSDRMVSMGMLAAGLVHEINNPLSAVIGNLQLAAGLVGEAAGAPGAKIQVSELQDELRDACESAERVRKIILDVKIFSRSEVEERSAVNVEQVMESTLRMAWNEIRHRARLVKDYRGIPLVEGSESRLGQVFLNLVVNAAQAIKEGHATENEIRVSTRTSDAGHAVVEIADTGSGIPAEDLGRIFLPFFTTKEAGVGTGLGLPICQRIISGLGGSIGVESTVGKGTVFRISLPAARAGLVQAPRPVERLEVKATRRGRVLVIDDEPVLVKAVKRMLSTDHEVVGSSKAREALDRIVKGERFDVILCDLMMPEMTGMEFHAEVSRMAADQALRIVFLTGGAFTSSARAFLDKTSNERVEKPFDADRLRALVNSRVR